MMRMRLGTDRIARLQLVDSCVLVLVSSFQESILNECATFIDRGDIAKLQMMFRLMNRTKSGIEPMLVCVSEYIRRQGLEDMRNNAEAITTVHLIWLRLHD